MLLSPSAHSGEKSDGWSAPPAAAQRGPEAVLGNSRPKLGFFRLISCALIFVGVTAGIFWYQFARIPAGSRAGIWNQLQWGYVFWLALLLPIDGVAAALRTWVVGRVLQPGVGFWTCRKAEWANQGLAMLLG